MKALLRAAARLPSVAPPPLLHLLLFFTVRLYRPAGTGVVMPYASTSAWYGIRHMAHVKHGTAHHKVVEGSMVQHSMAEGSMATHSPAWHSMAKRGLKWQYKA